MTHLSEQEGAIVVSRAPSLDPAAGAEAAFASAVLASVQTRAEPADDRSAEALKELAKNIREHRNRIDTSRKAITAPLRQAEEAVNTLLMPAVKDLEAAEKHLKGLILAFVQKGKAAAVEAMQQIAAGADALALPVPSLPSNTHTVKRWKFRVAAAHLVPREYCSPDEAKLQGLIDRHKLDKSAVLAVPGVEFYEDETLTIRGK